MAKSTPRVEIILMREFTASIAVMRVAQIAILQFGTCISARPGDVRVNSRCNTAPVCGDERTPGCKRKPMQSRVIAKSRDPQVLARRD